MFHIQSIDDSELKRYLQYTLNKIIHPHFDIFKFKQLRNGLLDKEITQALWNKTKKKTPNVVNNLRFQDKNQDISQKL